MIRGEARREQVISANEEERYLKAAQSFGDSVLESYRRALGGIRATMRDEQPIPPDDPYKMRDVATVLLDCGLRPDECFRLRWDNLRDDAVHIHFGKTANARRVIPLTKRASALIEMRRLARRSDEWVFPAPTRSGHIEKSSVKKQHSNVCTLAAIAHFPLYTFRHTCLRRWAAYMDAFTLAYLAGHSDFSTTRRYVHPQAHTVREAMERAQRGTSGHKTGHNDENQSSLEIATAPVC